MGLMDAYFGQDELPDLGLGSFGRNVLISRKCSLYGRDRLHLGNDVRVDDFVVISCGDAGEVRLGDHVHISSHASLFGGAGIEMRDFTNASSHAAIYSVTDDYSGDFLVNSMVPASFRHVIAGRVLLDDYAVLGAGSVVLPGVTVGTGSAVGSLSLVNTDLASWGIYAGIPARLLRARSRGLLQLAAEVRRGDGP
jgi:dTDP-4-amino-4,6-dideoxy-D-glucose acyltransferase